MDKYPAKRHYLPNGDLYYTYRNVYIARIGTGLASKPWVYAPYKYFIHECLNFRGEIMDYPSHNDVREDVDTLREAKYIVDLAYKSGVLE